MSDSFFDSNVLVYLVDETAPEKSQIAEALVDEALDMGNAAISFQVVQETLSVIVTKLRTPATVEQAKEFLISTLEPLWEVHPSRELYQKALEVQDRHQYGFYDSLIIAAALEAGCSTLYSEDMQHGQVIERLTIQDPFRTKL